MGRSFVPAHVGSREYEPYDCVRCGNRASRAGVDCRDWYFCVQLRLLCLDMLSSRP